jgi:hypothetical protein
LKPTFNEKGSAKYVEIEIVFSLYIFHVILIVALDNQNQNVRGKHQKELGLLAC